MLKVWEKGYVLFLTMFPCFIEYNSQQFAIEKGPQDFLKFIVQPIRLFFLKKTKVDVNFRKQNHLSCGQNGFGLFFGFTCDAVENTIIWRRVIFPSTFCWHSFRVRWSTKKFKEQFITAHFVSWHFLSDI